MIPFAVRFRLILITVILSSLHGTAQAELITHFKPTDTPAYWAGGYYLAEAVLFEVGETAVSLDEVWLHYDVSDSVCVYIIETLPDTIYPSLIHRVGEVRIPPSCADDWMKCDLRSAELTISGQVWVFIRNLELHSPPGISFRGYYPEDPPTSLILEEDTWGVMEGNFGVGIVINEPSSIGEDKTTTMVPRSSLGQNYPNPFNPRTTIPFEIKGKTGSRQQVNLSLYDVRGRLVVTLIDKPLPPGNHQVVWDGKDRSGETVPSGVYLSNLRIDGKQFIRKINLLE